MTARSRAGLQIMILMGVLLGLELMFPRAYGFAEMAARELHYQRWLRLLVAPGAWLIWGLGRKPKD